MSKELEALDELKYKGFYYSKDGIDMSTFVQMRLDIIETALKRLEMYDLIEKLPMPKVEVLEDNKISYVGHDIVITDKEQFDKDQKKLKAIKIIKNKLMYEIEPFDFMDYDTYEDYHQNYFEQRYEDENDYPDWWLTKDEFELLKDVFGKKYKNI